MIQLKVIDAAALIAADATPPDLYCSFANAPRWLAAVQACIAPDDATLFAVRDGSKIVGWFLLRPLVHVPRLRGRVLGTVQERQVTLTDLFLRQAYRNPAVLDDVLRQLSQEVGFDAIRCARVAARSSLSASLRGSAWSVRREDDGGCAFASVAAPEALDRLSKDTLRNVDRLRRRAERDHGAVRFESVQDASVADAAYERFLRVESAGWKGEAGTALAQDPMSGRFFREVLARFSDDAAARIDFLTIDGQDAAAQLAIRVGPVWYLQKIGFEPRFRDLGPGAILLKGFLEEMTAEPGIHEVNLTTNPAWAGRWHFEVDPCEVVTLYGRGVRGRAADLVDRGADGLRWIRRELRSRGRGS